MSTKFVLIAAASAAIFAAAGCGSQPEHEIKPLTSRPAPAVDFKSLSPEEKIKFIQNSKAPKSEQESAIAKVKAGQL